MDFVIEDNSGLHAIFASLGLNCKNTVGMILKDFKTFDEDIKRKCIIIVIHLKLYKSLFQIKETNPAIVLNEPLYRVFPRANLISVLDKLKKNTGLVIPPAQMTRSSFILLIVVICLVTVLMIVFFYFLEITFLVTFSFFTPLIFFLAGSIVWYGLKKWFPDIFSIEEFSDVYTYSDFLDKTYDLNAFLYSEERIKQDLFLLKSIDSLTVVREIEKLYPQEI